MLAQDTINRLTFVNEEGRRYLWQLAQELTFGSVVLFAGAGLSFNAVCRDGGRNRMPGWGDLSNRLRDRLDQDIRNDTDPLKVADYFETKFGRTALVEAVRDAIQDADHVPGRVHQSIARLNFEEIITTNFDTLLERSFRDQFVEPQVIVRGQDLVQRRRPPRIIKMNGCIRLNPGEIIITGNDFLSYAETHPWVQVFVTKSFIESTVLFLGFGLNDPAFRSINERVLSMLGRDNPRLAFSLQHGISRTEMEFWKDRQVQIIDLHSGEADSSLDHEERLHRVLEAFGEVQKERTKSLQQKQRSPLYPESRAGGTGLAKKQQVLIREMLAVIGSHLDEAGRLDVVCDRKPDLAGLSGLLGECVRRFTSREKRDPRCEEALGELSSWLKEICRLEDMESPGIQLSAQEWLPIRSLVDLLLASGLQESGGRRRDLLSNLRVLAALLSLKLLILAPRFAREWSGDEPRRAAARFLTALDLLDLGCLGTQDMQIRSRLVLLLCFFGPIHRIQELTEVWAGGRNEREIVGTGGKSRQDTPLEYRLLPLSFYGVLGWRHEFFKKAAESLWARHVFKDDPSGGWRIENAFRYRYLRQAAPDEEWASVRLHSDRLAHVLGQLSLEPEMTDPPAGGDPGQGLLAVLLELNRGWLLGCPPPEALYRAWSAAETQHARQKTGEVPWEMLILFSLPILGSGVFESRQRLLHEAWTAGHLDTCFLIDHTVRRLAARSFGRFMDHRAVEESPAGRYEAGLAHMVEWLARRATFESHDSPLKRKLAEDLLPSLKIWLCGTHYPEVRRSLLRSLESLRTFAAARVCEVVRSWALSRLERPDQRSSLELAVLDPPPGTLAMERHKIQMLLAYAQSPAAAGTSFRNDLLKWLVSWAEHGESIDSLTLTALGGQIVEFMTEPSRSGTSVFWLVLAAQIRLCSRLRTAVEEQLSRQLSCLGSSPLFELVKTRLAEMPEQNRETLREKGVLLAYLIPFAGDFDASMIDFVEGSLESSRISSEGRNHAVHLLAALLSGAPQDIRARRSARWMATLRRLLREGAIGQGLGREQIEALDAESLRVLQANLIVLLEREKEVRAREIVAEIAEKIRLGEAVPLAYLEEELLRSVQSPHEALAFHSLEAVLGLCREPAGFLRRNHGRIQHILGLVEALRNYRQPSRFAELLAELRDLEKKAAAASSGVEVLPMAPAPLATATGDVRKRGRSSSPPPS